LIHVGITGSRYGKCLLSPIFTGLMGEITKYNETVTKEAFNYKEFIKA